MKTNASTSVLTAGLLLVGTALWAGQEGPPIPGATGTIALQGTVDKTYHGINTIAVKTEDGVRHLLHFTTRTVVHGTKAASKDVLAGFEEGSRVVVHYTEAGGEKTAHEIDRLAADGVKEMSGVIVHVDNDAKTISIRLANGTEQAFRLTERAVSAAGKDIDRAAIGSARVVIYYTDEAGHRVAHYFKRVA